MGGILLRLMRSISACDEDWGVTMICIWIYCGCGLGMMLLMCPCVLVTLEHGPVLDNVPCVRHPSRDVVCRTWSEEELELGTQMQGRMFLVLMVVPVLLNSSTRQEEATVW